MMEQNRVGYVYCGDYFVGTLTEYTVPAGYEYEFRYDESYLSHGLAKIGENLPLTDEPYRKNHLPAFFANLMSEGWVKRHQARLARLDQDDKFGLLLGHGAELIGPLKVLTSKLEHPQEKLPAVLPRKSLAGYRIDFARSEFNEIAIASLGKASISGVQPKMFLTHKDNAKSVLTNSIGAGPYIVKPSPTELPELAINEFIIMRLCRLVGFNVADHELVPFSCGELAYVTPRFDLDPLGQHLGFIEDMASVMDVAPSQKSSDALSYEMVIKKAFACCGSHGQILKDGFLQVLMSYIVGNNDLHLKNISLIRPLDSDTATGFTKIYDMVSVAPYRVYDGTELSIWLLDSEVDNGFSTTSYQQYGYYTGNDFIAFAKAIGLGEKAGRSLMTSLADKVLRCIDRVLARAAGTKQMKEVIRARIIQRIDTLSRPPLA